MSKKRILVIGKGFLGETICRSASALNYEIKSTNFKNNVDNMVLDISDIDKVEATIKQINPDYIINSAARTDIDYLETHRDIAMQVNCVGAGNVAKIACQNNTRLLHISTDSVFDGVKGDYVETDKPNPINIYAKSKHKGEIEVKRNAKNYVIIRTNFYGLSFRGMYFFNWILNNIRKKNQMTGFVDIVFSPLNTDTLSNLILELASLNYTGIIHMSSGNPISKFEFIRQVIQQLKVSDDILKSGKQTENPLLVPRPKNTSLRNDLSKKILKTPIIDLSEWIEQHRPEINQCIK